ncbi:MAG: ArnT family glycosyltransferase [Bradymonadia bacterium]
MTRAAVTEPFNTPPITRRLLDVAVTMGLIYVVIFVVVALIRVFYPFEVEWMEGGMLAHAARLASGQPIYAEPSADFVPFFYTPGYPITLWGLSQITGGLSFTLGRLVSLAATLSTFYCLFLIGRREAGVRFGLLAMGIYASLFRLNGAFYDLVRPDALFITIMLWAVYVAYTMPRWRGVILAAVLCVVGFFTKQTASVFTPAIAVYLLWRNWRHGVVFGALAFGLGALGVYVANQATDGWFWVYTFEGHQGHLFYWKNILMEYWRDVLCLAPVLLLIPLLWFGYKVPIVLPSLLLSAHWTYAWFLRANSGWKDMPHMYYRELFYVEPHWLIMVPPAVMVLMLVAYRVARRGVAIAPRTHGFWLWMFVAGAGSSALNHSTQWAYSNCFMPLSVFGSILIALAVRDLTQAGDAEGTPQPSSHRWTALVPAALALQFIALAYNPAEQVPGSADHEAVAQLDRQLSEVKGKVFMPAHPFYAYTRDGQVHTHQMGIQDVAFMKGLKDLGPRLRKKEWAAVVVDERNRVPGLGRQYYLADRLVWPDKDVLRAKTGFLVRPAELWLAQDPEPRELAPGITGNFEAGQTTGWTASGGFSEAPAQKRRARLRSGRVSGVQGDWVMVSNRADEAGRLTSAPFTLECDRLTWMAAGDRKPGLEVRLLSNGELLHRKPVPSGRALRRVSLDTRSLRGREVQIELIDKSADGVMAADDFRCVRP